MLPLICGSRAVGVALTLAVGYRRDAGTPDRRDYGRRVPKKTCQARRDLASRLKSMYARSP
jgi:hypothetical protein